MSKPISMTTLKKLQKNEALYQQWLELLPQLEQAQATWQKADKVIQELTKYYTSPAWLEHYNANENGWIEERFEILGQDQIWDALATQRDLAMRWMRLGLEVIDYKN